MRKLFTIDDIVVSFASALGYGYGYTLSRLSGWPEPLCILATLALGFALNVIVDRIIFSEAVQRKPMNRFLAFAAVVLVFLAAHFAALRWLDASMVDYLLEEMMYTVGLPILGFAGNLILRAWRMSRIRERYGEGKKGFLFEVTEEDRTRLNGENRPISGDYDSRCAVKTRTGVFVGEARKGMKTFRGIPYARPPVGERRWKAPEPLPSSDAVFEAKHFGASPIQVEHRGVFLRHHRQSEDCLTLNICVGKGESPKPVLVLFPPGDFSYGGSANPLLSGEAFVRAHPDIVFVSLNYRLGLFGFIDFSGVPGGEACPDALNLGLLDQIQALRWIRENIAAFGGDPDRVTVAGFEGGAASISLLAVCGRAKGLFGKAFVFFGGPVNANDTPEDSRALAGELMKETGTRTMAELMRLDTASLKKAEQKLWMKLSGPTRDGTWIPADIDRAYQEGAAAGISFIIGIPSNEWQVFRAAVGGRNYRRFINGSVNDFMKSGDRSAAGAILARIRARFRKEPGTDTKGKAVEAWMNRSMIRSAAKLKEGGNQVYLLYWDEKPVIENLGSGMVSAVATFLGNSDMAQMYGSLINEDVAEVMQCLLEKFVSGKDPALYSNEIRGVDALAWKEYPMALRVSDGKIRSEACREQ